LLVQGFRGGQLNLKIDVPPGLAQMADPYDPTKNALYRFAPYGMYDLSYYKGKLYLDSGITPTVALFWPCVALTGRFLSYGQAGVIFCSLGFLASVGLLRALWRRYFAEVSVGVVIVGTLGLGLATFIPSLLARCDIYEVAVSCGYALTMLALAAVWKAMEDPERRGWWLAAGSLAYGLAVGARPNLLFGAVILLVPVAQSWRERRAVLIPLIAATVPMALIGLGLMLYNVSRFGSPFEFGWHYVLAGQRQDTAQAFHLRYLWFNFRVNFLEPARWRAPFPFVHPISVPPLPAGYGRAERPFGVLTNFPVVWLALAVPLAWRGRSGQTELVLRWFVMAVGLLFGICALTIGLFWSANLRYEVDFLPVLVLLAVVGILGVERALVSHRVWLRAARLGWSLLLGFSLAFNLLASVERYAELHCVLGIIFGGQGRLQEAIGQYEQALRIRPDYAEAHNNLGVILERAGRMREAIEHYEEAVRVQPDYAEAHYNLGIDLMGQGRLPEAIGHYERALQIRPNYAEAYNNLGFALMKQGKVPEAIAHYEQAVRLKPDDAEMHNNLAFALAQTGQVQDAIGHYEQALQLNPNYAEAHNNLGVALVKQGRLQEAIDHYKEAVRIKPDYASAQCNWGNALLREGNEPEAIGHYEQALEINPDLAEGYYSLGLALEKLGRTAEAVQHYQQALRIKPDFAQARDALARAGAVQ
jgi:tetratricopeptide (TPR) repeat protein